MNPKAEKKIKVKEWTKPLLCDADSLNALCPRRFK